MLRDSKIVEYNVTSYDIMLIHTAKRKKLYQYSVTTAAATSIIACLYYCSLPLNH